MKRKRAPTQKIKFYVPYLGEYSAEIKKTRMKSGPKSTFILEPAGEFKEALRSEKEVTNEWRALLIKPAHKPTL